MNVEFHPSQEFHLAENSVSCGCCGFWKSKPKEYAVTKEHVLIPVSKLSYRNRLESNERLCQIIKGKINCDPLEADILFERLKEKCSLQNGDPLTESKLVKIVSCLYELKNESIPMLE